MGILDIIRSKKRFVRRYCHFMRQGDHRYLDIHVVDHCNIACGGCAHFAPIAPKWEINLDDLDAIYRQLKPVMRYGFDSIHLMGGETLLHPRIADIIRMTREQFPDIEIQLVTNGLKLPHMSDDFWNVCVESDTYIVVSEYPVNINYDKVREILVSRHVRFEIQGRTDFIHYAFDLHGTQNADDSYEHCPFPGTCLQLRGTRIYPCAQAAYADIFNDRFGTDMRVGEGDWLELKDLASHRRLLKWLATPKPFCRYCDIANTCEEPWNPSRRKASEWLKTKPAETTADGESERP